MIGIVIAIIVVLLIALLFVAEKVFEKTNYYKNNYCQTDKLKGKDKVDFINTGSTFAYYGLDYQSVGKKGLNLALCPQSISSDFKMLKHYQKRYNPGATVFIAISDLAFAKKGYSETKMTDKYYKVLDKREIRDYNFFKAIRAKYLPILYTWKNFLRFYRDIKPNYDYECKVNENDIEAVEADAYFRCRSWMEEFDLKDLCDASQADKFINEFCFTKDVVKKMVAWCKDNGYNPVIVNLPVSTELMQNFSSEFLNAFYYDCISDIVKDTGASFIDLQKKEKLSDYLLYLDSCRLNSVGREIITKILLSECSK